MAAEDISMAPFIPECEVLYEGGETSEQLHDRCEKNPGHTHFYPMASLKMEDLPENMRAQETLEFIQCFSKFVVKVSVPYTSPERPNSWPGTEIPYPYREMKGSSRATRSGTGLIKIPFGHLEGIPGPCPCHICDKSEQRKDGYWRIPVCTARHVVFDKLEAKKTTCELFYLTENKDGVKEIYGTASEFEKTGRKVHADTYMLYCVTHDKDIANCLLEESMKSERFSKRGSPCIISHPHGRRQHISFGNLVHRTIVKQPSRSGKFECFVQESRNVRCRLPLFPWSCYNNKGSKNPDDRDVNSYLEMTPGTEFPFKLLQAVPPPDAKFLCSRDFTFNSNFDIIYTFPPGTKFKSNNKQSPFFPPEARFVCNNFIYFSTEGRAIGSVVYEYLVYDIPTCKGSSGAPIRALFDHQFDHMHCGALAGGFNRSAAYAWYPSADSHLRMMQSYSRRPVNPHPIAESVSDDEDSSSVSDG